MMDASSEQIAAERFSTHDVVMKKENSLQVIDMDPLPREGMQIEGAEQGGRTDARRKRRLIVLAVVAALAILATVIGVSVGLSNSKSAAASTTPTSSINSPSNEKTTTNASGMLTDPQTLAADYQNSQLDDDGLGSNQPGDFTAQVQERRNAILNKLYAISGEDQVKNEATPQNSAAKWIIDDDQMQLLASSPQLEQRYAVVVLYYALGGSGWYNRTGYLTAANECRWFGIQCSAGTSGNVRYIQLANNSLSGKLPYETGLFKSLESLNLTTNIVSGAIPATVYNLTSLKYLDLSSKQIIPKVLLPF